MVDTRITDGALLLRLPEPGDVEAMVAACRDPEIPRWTLVPSTYTRADADAWLPETRRTAEAGSALHLVVVDARDERLLGSVGFVELDLAAGYAEIGYWLGREARGRGVMARAVVLLRAHGVARLGLRTFEVIPHRENARSRRVAERTGFTALEARRPAPRSLAGADTPREHVAYVWRSSA